MELLEERIERWLRIDDAYGYGDGSGNGSGSSYGYGYGYGFDNGSGYGDGCGYGNDFGFGFGNGLGSSHGNGYGYGNGFDSGNGNGSGYGNGDGSNLKSINEQLIWIIDGVQTIINAISRNVAKGFILKEDLTLESCYVVKGHNKFAHGKTIKDAMRDLQEKIFDNLDTDKAIKEFENKFKNNKKYKGTTFYSWHHILTGSCKMGRDNFIKNHNLNLNKMYTVKEFIELTENAYGGDIIKELKQYYYKE